MNVKFLLTMLACFCVLVEKCQGLSVGRGIADMTGMVSEGTLYGYANPDQDARGLHSRQYSRAFIFLDEETDSRVVLVVAEILCSTQALKTELVERLEAEYGSLYTVDNVMITATHSHSTPGGHHTYWMYVAPTGGYISETVEAYANGMFRSIQQAHDNLQPGKVLYTSGSLDGAGISRSPYAYDQNPEDEKARYPDNVDKVMHLFKLLDSADQSLGMVNFFPVHTTTMKRDNHLISTDNKGFAAQRFESLYNQGAFPGQASIVGAFAQSSEGDVTPNIDGDMCDVTFDPCSYNTSTCPEDPNDPSLCNSYGPTREEFMDTQIIGERQLFKAIELFDSATFQIQGTVDYRHIYVNMSDVQVNNDPEQNTTCRPAMGYGFGAGATDGPGIPPFTQGELEYSPAVDRLVRRIYNYSDELVDCHYPKPILLPSGEIEVPIPWQPEIIPLQLFRIGTIYFVGVPAEFTTMPARRLTERVEQVLLANSVEVTQVILVGLANGFTSYVTTKEEYQVQRYEGASTTYGPNTLDAYLLMYSEIAEAMATGAALDPGPSPPDLRGENREALDNITVDLTPDDLTYGDMILDVEEIYVQGDTVTATFVAGNPRHDMKTDATFLEVQRQADPVWNVAYTDAHWETKFYWDSNCHDISFPSRQGCDTEQMSNATIQWDIPSAEEVGTYRIVYYGDALEEETGSILSFEGISSEFQVVTEAMWNKLLL